MHRLGTLCPFGLNSKIIYIKPLTLCPLGYFFQLFSLSVGIFQNQNFFSGV